MFFLVFYLGGSEVNFLGMSLSSSQIETGQWILLAIGLMLLITTIALGVIYFRRRRKGFKSSSEMELK